jgi:hypothetical protein
LRDGGSDRRRPVSLQRRVAGHAAKNVVLSDWLELIWDSNVQRFQFPQQFNIGNAKFVEYKVHEKA